MKLDLLIEQATTSPKKTVAVAVAEDKEIIEAVVGALRRNLANFRLFGDEVKVNKLLQELAPDCVNSEAISLIAADSPEDAAELAVKSVSSGEADVLMKGNLSTSLILSAVLHKEWGLRTGNVLSHNAVFEVEGFDRLIFVTDAAMNIAPNLDQKAQIIGNAVQLARSIGINQPKVAPICAVEVVNPVMQATLDAAALTQMNRRGQIKDCIVDGPLALDNAISVHATKQKGIVSEVAGMSDILLVPNIETGNALYKSLIYFAKAKVGAVISGAKAPIVLTSRADSSESKLYSLALAIRSVHKII
ncbi:phosphate butyryltransferase [Cytobacillus sp. Hm23]